MEFDFIKDRYDFELERKETLTGALTLPAGVLTGLGSLVAVMGRSFSYSYSRTAWWFLGFAVADVAAFAVCLWHLAWAYHSQTYELLPAIGQLVNAEREWLDWAKGDKDREALLGGFRGQLEKSVISAADHNSESNNRRSAYLHRANVCLFTVLALTALAGIPYTVDQARIRAEEMRRERPPTTQPSSTPAPSLPRPQASTPPPFPPNRIIREGDIPGRPTTR